MALPKIAFIGTGGTIASLGRGPLDLQDYGAIGNVMHAEEIVAKWPVVHQVADVIPVMYRNIPSTAIDFADWKALVALCRQLPEQHPGLAGIVIGHGTATLEETAYFLNLTLKTAIPVVLVGAQRPSSALSSDAGMNLVNAIRVAASPDSHGMGVLVLLNDEIHAAREVTKTSTLRLQAFCTPDFGVLGHADGDAVVFYRQPLRRRAPDTEFDISDIDALPRVDILYAYAGGDGTCGARVRGSRRARDRLGRVCTRVHAAGRGRGTPRGRLPGDRRCAIDASRVGTDLSQHAPQIQRAVDCR